MPAVAGDATADPFHCVVFEDATPLVTLNCAVPVPDVIREAFDDTAVLGKHDKPPCTPSWLFHPVNSISETLGTMATAVLEVWKKMSTNLPEAAAQAASGKSNL